MKISISGASGFLGGNLSNFFNKQGYEVIALKRGDFSKDAEALAEKIEGSAVVIHLAGAPIAKRWTAKHKQQIYDSRILTTRKLADAMQKMSAPPDCFICASAVGIYADEGVHGESSTGFSNSFLGKVCLDWEAEAMRAKSMCRTLVFRFGIVLGRDGGALQKMALPFKMGLGGRIASGKQMMSWVHLDDVAGIAEFAISNPGLEGALNICAPEAVSNRVFTQELAKALRRPAIFPVPAFMLKLVFGEGAVVLTGGQAARPDKLMEHGYRFRHDSLDEALRHIFAKP